MEAVLGNLVHAGPSLPGPQGETTPPVRTFESRNGRILRGLVTSLMAASPGSVDACACILSTAASENVLASLGQGRENFGGGQSRSRRSRVEATPRQS